MVLTVLVPKGSRSKAYAYFDGSRIELLQGDRVTIDASAATFPTIDCGDTTSHWFASLHASFSYGYQRSDPASRKLSIESPMGTGFGDELQEDDGHDECDIDILTGE